MKGQPLEGLIVVEDSRFISAAYCTKLMADLGAKVIKIERPNCGDDTRKRGPFSNDVPDPECSGSFLWLNANKLSITLNLKTSTGREILFRLLKESDVFVENYTPKQMEILGIKFEALAELNPRLIMVSITAFGQTGPYNNYRAYAINSAAAGGISFVVGSPSREPLAPPLELGHIQSGAAAATAVGFALIAREKNGQGQHIDVSEAESWSGVHTGHLLNAFIYHQRKRMRSGHRIAGAAYPYTVLPCKDGFVYMIAIQGSEWARFLRIIGEGKIPDWYENDARFKDRIRIGREYADEMDALLKPWLMSHTKEEIFNLCLQHRVPFAPVKTMREVVNDKHLNARGYFQELDHPKAGKIKYPGPPYRFSDLSWKLKRPAPLLGEHNEEIYCGRLGFSHEQLVNLKQGGII